MDQTNRIKTSYNFIETHKLDKQQVQNKSSGAPTTGNSDVETAASDHFPGERGVPP